MRGVLDIPEDLQGIHTLVTDALGRVEARFNDQLISDLPPVDAMCAHVERYRGKMLRPTLVLVCGMAAKGVAGEDTDPGSPIRDEHEVCAAVCEMVHMATLVHDDVLDEAEIRRRGATINSMTGNETSVILGDYLIASAYELCSTLGSPVPARIVGAASAEMCTGELLQLHNRGNLSLDLGTYFEILTRKTAALIGAACELGALCTLGFDRRDTPAAAALRRYGVNLGVAFQIQDDVLDLTGTTEGVGKSVGKDLEKGKLTHPLIHHLGSCDAETRERTLGLIREPEALDEHAERELLGAIRETGSLDATRDAARSFVDAARSALNDVPEGPARSMLALMAHAVVDRAY